MSEALSSIIINSHKVSMDLAVSPYLLVDHEVLILHAQPLEQLRRQELVGATLHLIDVDGLLYPQSRFDIN